jgi:tetratricopeptide (TPR) repeat protein
MNQKTSTNDIIRWLIYGLIVLVPTVYHIGFDSAFTMPKLTVLRLITLMIVGVWGLQIFAQGEIRYRKSPLNRWIIGYGIVSAITTLFSSYFWVSLFGDNERFVGLMTVLNLLFLTLVMMSFIQNKKELYSYIKVSVWTAIVLAVYGLLQFKGIVGAEGWTHDPTLRVFGTMGHSNHFGAYLAFHVMLLAGIWFNARQTSEKVIYGIAVLPMLATILATASRGAFFALLASAIVFGLAIAYQNRGWIKKRRKKFLTGLVIVLLGAAIFHKPLVSRFTNLSLTQRTVSTIQFMREGNVPDRVSWWYSSLAMTRDNPVLGHGLSTFRDVYNQYRRTDYRVPGDIQDTFTPETAHMEYFHIAATQGLLGLVFYLGMILCWLMLLVRVMKDKEVTSSKKITALSLLTAGLVYLFQVVMSFGVIGTLVPLHLLLGASAAWYHINSDPDAQSRQFNHIRLRGGHKLGFVLVVLTVFVFSLWFTFRQAGAELQIQKGDLARSNGEVAQMLDHYKAATVKMPWMYEYWQVYGEGAFHFGTFDNEDLEIVGTLLKTSIDAYENAYSRMKTMPTIQGNLALSYVVYADVLEAQGQMNKAKELREKGSEFYREAVDVAVNNPVFSYTYGKLLRSLNRNDEAENAFLYVLELRDSFQDTNYQLALLATEAKDYDSARSYIQKALQDFPGDDNVKNLQQRINSEANANEEL